MPANRHSKRTSPHAEAGGTDLRKEWFPDEPLVPAEDVAAFLAVQPAWVLEQARAGDLPSYKLGHYRRFRLSEIEERLSVRASATYKRRNVLGSHQADG